MKVVLFVSLLIFAAVVCAQEQRPVITGEWEDTVCNLLPRSDNWYQKRTVYYGVETNTNSGLWRSYTQVYNSSTCDESLRLYDLTYDGSYRFTGDKAVHPENFWDINYGFDKKYMRIYKLTFQNWLEQQPSCAIGGVFLGKSIDITHTPCHILNIVPIEKCPVLYDIIRVENPRLWVGAKFYGDPYVYHSNCQREDRPDVYDVYGLGLLADQINGQNNGGNDATLSYHLNIGTIGSNIVDSAASVVPTIVFAVMMICLLL